MRLKLVLIVSLLAAVVGAGVPVLIIIATLGSFVSIHDPQFSHNSHGWLALLLLVPPLVAALLASIFVYRHTARRRKLQAALALVLALLLTFGVHMVSLFLN